MRKILIYMAVMNMAVFAAVPTFAAGMTVEQAYKLQKHQQTTFDKSVSTLSEEDAKYLDHLFFVTDMAFRERMTMLAYFRAHKADKYIEKYNEQISALLGSFDMIKAPNKTLALVEDEVKNAIKEQRAFFYEWHATRDVKYYNALSKNPGANQRVQSAHRKLINAYGLLKKQYPREVAHNQQAFYDHLCALDFI